MAMSPEVIDEEDAEAIAQGLQGYSYDAKALVNAILNWTGGQPFLAQRLCQITIRVLEGELVLHSAAMPRDPVNLIDAIVRGLIIEHWESQDNSEHLRTIRDRLLRKELFAPRLLGIYQSILLAFRTGHTSEVRSVTFSPDGEYLLSASLDGTVRLWNLAGRSVRVFRGYGDSGLIDANFSPDGKLVVAGGFDSMATIWSIDGDLLRTLEGHESEVRSAMFSSDGKQIVTASGDGTTKVWQVESGQLVTTLSDGADPLWSALFVPGDRAILSAGENRRACFS